MKTRQIVFDIHRLKDEGYSTRKIAKLLQMGRNTVIRYLKEPEKGLEQRKKKGSILDPFKPQIKEYLEIDPTVNAPVVLKKILEQGYKGEITLIRYYLRELRGDRVDRKPYLRYESPPGQQCQVDWAHFDTICYGDTKRRLYALVVVESFSRMLYVEFTHSQKQEVLHGCLLNAFEYFGGTPKTVLVDNMLTAVTSREGRLIRFNDAFLDFLRPFRIIPEACNPRAPYEKGKVENAVKYLKKNFMPLRKYQDLTDIQMQVLTWLDKTANLRVHQTTAKIPIKRLNKESLRALPVQLIIPQESYTLLVHKDFAVRFDSNSYTTPPWTVGRRLTLKADQHMIWIFNKEKQLCSYTRCWDKKQRIENPSHVEQVKRLKNKQWENREIAHFASLGEEFLKYLKALPSSRHPLKKQISQLLHLKDQYGVPSLSWAIQRALRYNAYGSDYIENILNQEMIPTKKHPPVKLQNEALNRIRLSEPMLQDYDALVLKSKKRKNYDK